MRNGDNKGTNPSGAKFGADCRAAKRARSRKKNAWQSGSGSRRKVIRAILLTLLGGLGALALSIGLLLPFTPSHGDLAAQRARRPSIIVTADGAELKRFADGISRPVELDRISPDVVAALVATEDHRFHKHGGIDFFRLVTSVGRSLTGDLQGGSTLSMQLARNLYPERIGDAPGPVRKLKEWITAVRIERSYTKDEIIEAYLNVMPFLYGVRGIEMAAQTYFSKSAEKLTLTESATLVGMLKATSYYNPVRHPDRAERRRNVVLHQMLRRGKITQERHDAAVASRLATDFSRPDRHTNPAPHFTEHLRPWLEDWVAKHGYDLLTDGLVVHTTIHSKLQKLAREAVARQGESLQAVADVEWSTRNGALLSSSPHDYPKLRANRTPFQHFWETHPDILDDHYRNIDKYRELRESGKSDAETLSALRADGPLTARVKTAASRLESGFVAIDPRSGKVRAWVGSRGFAQGPYDHVASARRQPGSTFKPFLYGAALQDGYKADNLFKDQTVTLDLGRGQTWQPASAGGATDEWFTMKEALAYSKNTITAQIMDDVGPRRVARFAQRAGIRSSRLRAVPSLALGTSEVTLLEMASAYATIAAGGVYRKPLLVTHITDFAGDTLAVFTPSEERVIEEDDAHVLADMMRGTVDFGTGRRIRSVFGVRCDVAGKTGTTQENADGWFMLMHPELVGGSWVGFNDQRVRFRSDYWGQGSHNALYVVGDFYRHALRQGQLSPTPVLAPFPENEQAPDLWHWARSLLDNGEKVRRSERPSRYSSRPKPPEVPERARRIRDREADEFAKQLKKAQRDLESFLERIGREIDIDDLEDGAERVLDHLRDRIEELESELDR